MPDNITLYGPARAPFTEKCRRALVLKGLDFELREPSGPEDYKLWSPDTGMLPVMRVDGELVSDSTEILLYLDQLEPKPPLLASDPRVAAQQRSLEEWADESFLWYWLQWLRLSENGDGQQPEARSERRSPWLRRTLAWLRAGGTWERPVTGLLRELGDRLDDLVNFLGSRPFFYAEKLSVADLGVYSMLFTMRNESIPGAGKLIEVRPTLVN